MKIALDGAARGGYRGDCECGMSWNGSTPQDTTGMCSPALPVAEAVVHMRMCHDETYMELVFTLRFENWLKSYWQQSDLTHGLHAATMTR